jgi:hypothetical protein
VSKKSRDPAGKQDGKTVPTRTREELLRRQAILKAKREAASSGGTVITEDSSEKTVRPQKRRGRPASYSPSLLHEVMNQKECSRRGAQSYLQACSALFLLNREPQYAWLIGPQGKGPWRWSLLGELGRIDDEDEMRKAAAAMCRLKPSAREGVALLRSVRLQKEKPPPSVEGLTGRLTDCLNDYLHTHAECSWEDVLVALGNVAVAVRKAAGFKLE